MKKGGKVKNQETEVEIVKLVNNPMDEYASLNEYEKHIVDAVKKNVSGLHDILQMRMFNEKKNGKMVGYPEECEFNAPSKTNIRIIKERTLGEVLILECEMES